MANKRFGWRSGDVECRELKAEKGNIPQIVTLGLPQTIASVSFPYEVTTNTEQAAAYCKVYDISALEYQNLATSGTGDGYTANYQLFPDADAIGDAVYFGAANKFGALYFDMGTNQTYAADSLTWEYWDGTDWVAFTPYDVTDQTAQDGKRSFGADGYIFIHAPLWVGTTIDNQAGFWVRARVTTASVNTIGLTNSKEHYVVTSTGSRIHTKGKISKGCFKFNTGGGTGNDTKFIVANLSQGYFDDITLTQTILNMEVTMDVNVESGDYLAFYCYQEDGATENALGTVELYVDKR